MSVQIKKLNSGVTILSNRFNSNTLSFGMWLDVGSVNEKKDQFGIAHMLEHMAFKGTSKRSAAQIVREIEDIGGRINAYTSKEVTSYYVKLLPEKMTLGVDILSDILINSNFPADEIERERGVILSEIGESNDDPHDKVFQNLHKVAFKGQTLGKPILGTKKTVNNFSKDNLTNFFSEFYNASNLIVGVCGNFDQDNFEQLINSKFKNLRVGVKSAKPKYKWNSGNIFEEKDIEQSHVVFGIKGLGNTDNDRFALRALSIIFGGGMSSKLFQRIREEKGLCYSIFSFCAQYSSSGIFGFYSACLPKDLKSLIEESLKQFKKLKNEISIEDVEKAKSQMKSGFLMGQDSSMNRLETDIYSIFSFGKVISDSDVLKKIDTLDVSKVKDVLSRIIDEPKPVLSIVGPGGNDFKNIKLQNYF